MKFFLLTFLLSFQIQAGPLEFTNMVVVNSKRPFLIEIFETSNKSTALMGLSNLWPGAGNKPARISFSNAIEYCESIGLKLPTKNQWMIAASNNHQNIYYTLRGDGGLVNGEEINFNISSDSSKNITDFNSIGLDAVGTIGMTGNRAEWAQGENGDLYQCGGDYTSMLRNVLLKNICKKYSWEDIKATARCTYPLKAGQDIIITLSNLKREHLNYIQSIKADLFLDDYLNSFLIDSPNIPEIEDDLGPTDPENW
jgi:hypothetical protein